MKTLDYGGTSNRIMVFLVFLEHQKSSGAEFTCLYKGLNNFNVLKPPLRCPNIKATTLYITLAEYYELTINIPIRRRKILSIKFQKRHKNLMLKQMILK